MKVKTQLRAGKMSANHNQTLAVRTALKAGMVEKIVLNHNETLAVRTSLKAGMVEKIAINHNETLQTRTGLKAGRKAMKRAVLTTVCKGDRLELMVVRAGLRAGKARDRVGRR